MPEPQQTPAGEQSPPPRKKHRYSPYSIIAAPLSLPFGLEIGKAIGEALEWSKVATVVAECIIGGAVALVLAVTINFFFGKEVEIADKKSP